MSVLRNFQLVIHVGPDSEKAIFNHQTRSVTALVERLLPKITTEGIQKVVFWCDSEVRRPGYRTSGGICELDIMVDVEEFFTLPDEAKKEWTLQALKKGVEALLPQIGWDRKPFDQAFADARALGLRNEWVWKQRMSPSRQLTAQIFVQHEVNECRISMLIRTRKGDLLKQKLLISDMPHEFVFVPYLGTLKWESDTRAVLTDVNGERSWAVDL